MTARILASTMIILGVILPASVTLIFKNGCRQDNTYSARHSASNAPSVGSSVGAEAAQGRFTDVSDLPVQAKETPRRK